MLVSSDSPRGKDLGFLVHYSILRKGFVPPPLEHSQTGIWGIFKAINELFSVKDPRDLKCILSNRSATLLYEVRICDGLRNPTPYTKKTWVNLAERISECVEDFYSYIKSYPELSRDYYLLLPMFKLADELKRINYDNVELWERLTPLAQRVLSHLAPLAEDPGRPTPWVCFCIGETAGEGMQQVGCGRVVAYSCAKVANGQLTCYLQRGPATLIRVNQGNNRGEEALFLAPGGNLKEDSLGRVEEIFNLAEFSRKAKAQTYGTHVRDYILHELRQRYNAQIVNLLKFYHQGLLGALNLPVAMAAEIADDGGWEIFTHPQPTPLLQELPLLPLVKCREVAKDIYLHIRIEKMWGLDLFGEVKEERPLPNLFRLAEGRAIVDRVRALPAFLQCSREDLNNRHARILNALKCSPGLYEEVMELNERDASLLRAHENRINFLREHFKGAIDRLPDWTAFTPYVQMQVVLAGMTEPLRGGTRLLETLLHQCVASLAGSRELPLQEAVFACAASLMRMLTREGSKGNVGKVNALSYYNVHESAQRQLRNLCVRYLFSQIPRKDTIAEIIQEVLIRAEELLIHISKHLQSLKLQPAKNDLYKDIVEMFMTVFGSQFLDEFTDAMKRLADPSQEGEALERSLTMLQFAHMHAIGAQVQQVNDALRSFLHDRMISRAKQHFVDHAYRHVMALVK